MQEDSPSTAAAKPSPSQDWSEAIAHIESQWKRRHSRARLVTMALSAWAVVAIAAVAASLYGLQKQQKDARIKIVEARTDAQNRIMEMGLREVMRDSLLNRMQRRLDSMSNAKADTSHVSQLALRLGQDARSITALSAVARALPTRSDLAESIGATRQFLEQQISDVQRQLSSDVGSKADTSNVRQLRLAIAGKAEASAVNQLRDQLEAKAQASAVNQLRNQLEDKASAADLEGVRTEIRGKPDASAIASLNQRIDALEQAGKPRLSAEAEQPKGTRP